MNRTIAISLFLLLTNVPSPKLFGQEKLRVLSGARVRVWVSDMVKKSFSGSFIGATLKRESWQEMPVTKLGFVFPESTKPQKQAPFAKALPQSIYFEAFGSGLIYSINYDRMFTNAVGGRFGIMYFPSGTENEMSLKLPFTANYLVGSSEHKLEMSAGVIVILDSREIGDLRKEGAGAGVAGTLFYGYRYQPMKTGFFFRIGVSPIFTSNRFLLWGGLSLGVSF